jgi:hypothetical protein
MNYSEKSTVLLSRLLSSVNFQGRKKHFRLENDLILLIEQSFSDFGDADAVLLFKEGGLKKSIFFEAKVKTSLRKTWSIKAEFADFKKSIEGVNKKVSSTNLFMQLYLKQALWAALKKNGLAGLQGNGIPFPSWSSKRIRKLGKNEVVKRATEKLDCWQRSFFVAIVPDKAQEVEHLFENRLRKYHPKGCEYWDTQDWGFLTWQEIENFAKEHCLRDTLEVFKHNKGQIY